MHSVSDFDHQASSLTRRIIYITILGILQNKPVQLVADSNPRVATALDDIREMYRLVGELGGPRRLTRIHVHTLAYQAIVTVKGKVINTNKFLMSR